MTLQDAADYIGMAPRRLREAVSNGDLVAWEVNDTTVVSPAHLGKFLSQYARRMNRQHLASLSTGATR